MQYDSVKRGIWVSGILISPELTIASVSGIRFCLPNVWRSWWYPAWSVNPTFFFYNHKAHKHDCCHFAQDRQTVHKFSTVYPQTIIIDLYVLLEIKPNTLLWIINVSICLVHLFVASDTLSENCTFSSISSKRIHSHILLCSQLFDLCRQLHIRWFRIYCFFYFPLRPLIEIFHNDVFYRLSTALMLGALMEVPPVSISVLQCSRACWSFSLSVYQHFPFLLLGSLPAVNLSQWRVTASVTSSNYLL